jgi:hypothetical protein
VTGRKTIVVAAVGAARREGFLQSLGDQDRTANASARLQRAVPVALYRRDAESRDHQCIFGDGPGIVPALFACLHGIGGAERQGQGGEADAFCCHALSFEYGVDPQVARAMSTEYRTQSGPPRSCYDFITRLDQQPVYTMQRVAKAVY